jgi:CRP/FNR family transcriptional regulator, cyclic AMP receptor protein
LLTVNRRRRRSAPALEEFGVETISIFKHAPNAQAVAAGTILFSQGDAALEMYVVVSGKLDIAVNGATVETVEEGGIVGEMAMVNHQSPRTATVTALTDSVVVALTEDQFLRHVHSTPFFALQVLRITAERLRRSNARVEPVRP